MHAQFVSKLHTPGLWAQVGALSQVTDGSDTLPHELDNARLADAVHLDEQLTSDLGHDLGHQ
jgi:hypothetical protein